MASSENFISGKEFYSQVLSPRNGNLNLSEGKRSNIFVRESYSLCVYNTVEHMRRTISKKINFYETFEKNSEGSNHDSIESITLRDIIAKNVSESLAQWQSIIRAYEESKIRVEGYLAMNAQGRSDECDKKQFSGNN